MATVSNTKTKLKLVHTMQNTEGDMVQVSKTYSNIAPAVENDALLEGANALAQLLADEPVEVRRVDEAVISE